MSATCPAVGKKRTRLSERERRLYDSIPPGVRYVPHPDYRLAATEDQLFGPQAEPVPVPTWRQFDADGGRSVSIKPRAGLTREQESVLFMRYNYARYRLAGLMRAQRRRFSHARGRRALSWYRRAMENRSALASANMPLVVAMAKRTHINSVEFGELISEGNMALLRAVENFDVTRGFKFSTYACRAILKSFGRLATSVGKYRQHFPTEFDPALEQSDEVERRHRDQRELALEDLRRVLEHNAASLTRVEQAVLSARFALAGRDRPRTLEEVGQMVGLSKERVRQVQIRSLSKIRAALDRHSAA